MIQYKFESMIIGVSAPKRTCHINLELGQRTVDTDVVCESELETKQFAGKDNLD